MASECSADAIIRDLNEWIAQSRHVERTSHTHCKECSDRVKTRKVYHFTNWVSQDPVVRECAQRYEANRDMRRRDLAMMIKERARLRKLVEKAPTRICPGCQSVFIDPYACPFCDHLVA